MKLLFKQRFFSWLDSYDIYDEFGKTVFTVEGKFGWGHRLHILDADGNHIGTVKERVLTFLPRFEFYENDNYLGEMKKEFTLFKPAYEINFNGWQVNGDFLEWDYEITDAYGESVARVSKEIFNWTDTYVINLEEPQAALYALMVVLAIDAEKCSRK